MVSFHIEPTSKCTLECPLCDRTWFYETFKKRNLHEINVDNIIKFVGVNANVALCGNNGDPIYHSRFLELCEKFKNNNCSLHIHTNGSAKTKVWWKKLNNVLTNDDCITFAIDGLEDTNHIYTRSILERLFTHFVYLLRKTISYFSFCDNFLSNYYSDWFHKLDYFTEIISIGHLLYTDYVIQFLLSGNILLLATIGPVTLVLVRSIEASKKQVIFKQLSRTYSSALYV